MYEAVLKKIGGNQKLKFTLVAFTYLQLKICKFANDTKEVVIVVVVDVVVTVVAVVVVDAFVVVVDIFAQFVFLHCPLVLPPFMPLMSSIHQDVKKVATWAIAKFSATYRVICLTNDSTCGQISVIDGSKQICKYLGKGT